MNDVATPKPLPTWIDVESEVLRLLNWVFLPAALTVAGLYIFEVVSHGRWHSPLVVAVVLTIGATLALRYGRRHIQKASVAVGGFAVSVISIGHIGPMIGAGFLYAGTVILTAVLYGRRWSAVVYVGLIIALVERAYAPELFAPIVLDTQIWPRIILVAIVSLGALTVFANMLVETVKRALEVAARAAEERAALHDERERLIAHAMQAERLESLGLLAGGVAHEFNNALVAVRGGLDLIADGVPADAELLSMMGKATDDAADIARSLMSFAKRQDDTAVECDPSVVLGGLKRKTRKLFATAPGVVWQLNEAGIVGMSPSDLEEVALHLLMNARDASPKEATIHITCGTNLGVTFVDVHDDGPGIAPTVRSRMYDPFFTTRDAASGLGLAVVWGHVQRAGGTIDVESSAEAGTTFRMKFPPRNGHA